MRRVLIATAIAAIALVGLSANSCSGEKKEEAAPPAAAPAAPAETPRAATRRDAPGRTAGINRHSRVSGPAARALALAAGSPSIARGAGRRPRWAQARACCPNRRPPASARA